MTAPNHSISSLLLQNCNFATLMNHNVNIWNADIWYVNPKGSQSTGWELKSNSFPRGLFSSILNVSRELKTSVLTIFYHDFQIWFAQLWLCSKLPGHRRTAVWLLSWFVKGEVSFLTAAIQSLHLPFTYSKCQVLGGQEKNKDTYSPTLKWPLIPIERNQDAGPRKLEEQTHTASTWHTKMGTVKSPRICTKGVLSDKDKSDNKSIF